jgi:hypothetical protein
MFCALYVYWIFVSAQIVLYPVFAYVLEYVASALMLSYMVAVSWHCSPFLHGWFKEPFSIGNYKYHGNYPNLLAPNQDVLSH